MLIIENLTKIYDNGFLALDNISLEIPDGQFVAIIGLSGSGKSTLLRCINRLVQPTKGRIIWNGVDVTAATDDELRQIRRRIGMIFQQFNLVKRSSVLTNVLAGRLGYVSPMFSLLNYFPAQEKQRALAGIEYRAVALPGADRLLPAYHVADRALAASGLGRWLGPFALTVGRKVGSTLGPAA